MIRYPLRSIGQALILIAACLLIVVSSVPVTAEDDATLTAEEEQLKSALLANYRVLLLQDGLLLESRQEGAAAGAIEVSGAGLSVDGEVIAPGDLEELVGDDSALINSLSEIDPERLHLIFGSRSEEPTEIEASEVAEMWTPESERSPRAERAPRHRRSSRYSEPKVSVGSGLTVEDDEVVKGNVTVFGGPLIIRGEVKRDAVVFGNSARVEGGKIHGDITAIGGSLSLDADSEVLGSVVSVGGSVDRHEDAEIHGDIVEVPFGPNLDLDIWPGVGSWSHTAKLADFKISPLKRTMKIMWQIFSLLLIGLLGCLVMLLAPRPLDRVERKVATEPWKSGLVGFLAQILFAPLLLLVIVVLCLSIIGIPLLILIPFAILGLCLVSFLGYAAVALRIGRWAEARFGWRFGGAYVTLLMGVILINGWAVLGEALSWGWGPLKIFAAMFFMLWFLFCYVAWTVGLGAALLTRFGTAEGWSGAAVAAVAVVPSPPPGAPTEDSMQADQSASAAAEEEAVTEEGARGWSDEPIEPDDEARS